MGKNWILDPLNWRKSSFEMKKKFNFDGQMYFIVIGTIREH